MHILKRKMRVLLERTCSTTFMIGESRNIYGLCAFISEADEHEKAMFTSSTNCRLASFAETESYGILKGHTFNCSMNLWRKDRNIGRGHLLLMFSCVYKVGTDFHAINLPLQEFVMQATFIVWLMKLALHEKSYSSRDCSLWDCHKNRYRVVENRHDRCRNFLPFFYKTKFILRNHARALILLITVNLEAKVRFLQIDAAARDSVCAIMARCRCGGRITNQLAAHPIKCKYVWLWKLVMLVGESWGRPLPQFTLQHHDKALRC